MIDRPTRSVSNSFMTIVLAVGLGLLAAGCSDDRVSEEKPLSSADTNVDAGTDIGTDTSTDTGTDSSSDVGADTDAGFDAGSRSESAPWDLNEDGKVNILVIGTNVSIKSSGEGFSPDGLAGELKSILALDSKISVPVNVVAEDIYRKKNVTSGIAGMLTSNLNYFCHSLLQYYYWPEGHGDRMANLAGDNGVDWDYVVFAADPHIVSTLPGYYALGAHKLASKVVEGKAVPLLLMTWPRDESGLSHFEEFTYRAAAGAVEPLQVVPAGLAWGALQDSAKDTHTMHPTPRGAYLAAATIYAQVSGVSATSSGYIYDPVLANAARSAVVNAASDVHFSGARTFESPFKNNTISASALIYNHGGTSTENGILEGLQRVVTAAGKTLEFSESSPIHFNYGRSSMGSTHLYSVDGTLYDFSLGYPLQDDATTGKTSMLYGLDKRVSEKDVETDLGVALHMVRKSELPHARTVPLRTLVAQLLEDIPGFEIYSDNWHMSPDFNTAIASYMYTLLTSDCAQAGKVEPADPTSPEWRTWMAFKVGYSTAWRLMNLKAVTPCYGSN